MSTPYRASQFEDSDGAIDRRIEELRRSQQASAASRAVASTQLGFAAAGRQRATDSASAFMSILGTEAGVGASPYYQRQAHSSPYPRPFLGGQASTYAGVHSPNDVAVSLYARRATQAAYGYGVAPTGTSPEQRFHAPYGVHTTSGSDAFNSQYYARQPSTAHDMALVDRAYSNVQRSHEQSQVLPSTKPSLSSLSAARSSTPSFPKGATKQSPSPPKSSPTSSRNTKAGPASSRKGAKGGGSVDVSPSEKETPAIDSKLPNEAANDDDDESRKWYAGSVPLGLEDDKYWLSELQVYLRANFAEAFGATEEDIAAPMHGRNKPIALGQVGIRCMHCKNENPSERGQQATSYPSLISGIYNSVQQMLRLHLDCCLSMDPAVREKIEQLKLSSSSRGGRKQYWIDSAKRLGMVDTPHGIHFGRDPRGPLPPLTGPSVNSKEGRKRKADQAKTSEDGSDVEGEESQEHFPKVDPRPLVFPEDKPLISDFLYLTLEQMSPCVLMEADRVGCYKTRKVGFPGLACKHCVGQAGCGRYFPASEASLSQTTTSQTIMNHVRNCRRCPIEIRENLEIMKRARMGPDGKRADKPKHGGRKVFFHRLWCRIQGIPMEEGKGETKEKKKRGKKTATQKPSKKRQTPSPDSSDHSDEEQKDDADADADVDADADADADAEEVQDGHRSSDDEDATDQETSVEVSDNETPPEPPKVKAKVKVPPPQPKVVQKTNRPSTWHKGCVRLTKTDDIHWLSEMECFARSDLVEVFSLTKEDSLEGYGGRKDPSIGQVGIRCIFCKALSPSERPTGCLTFPDTLSSIPTKVGDLIRLHFPSCPSLPDSAREKFKSLRGFDAKVADDSQQYWHDAARDIGLGSVSPESPDGSWGIRFRRDPLQPSPADELDRELIGATSTNSSITSLVRTSDDRGLCTDQVMLLLRNVKPCRFKKSDRRGGPGARGRDRVIGFPGLCCMHCCSTRNSIGRYFPVSAKNLTDSTANSLQSHVSSCSRCPEPIKASLAYLSHRSILQKAELSGSWKKSFFKKVWDRLHVERAWSTVNSDEEEGGEKKEEPAEAPAILPAAQPQEDEESNDVVENVGVTDSEEEEMGDGRMVALIKAAAIWLTDQDATTDNTTQRRGTRGRSLPQSKRSVSPRGKGGGLLTSKRRRVL